jgi:hypothetical protein
MGEFKFDIFSKKYHLDRAIIYLLTYAGLRVDELSNINGISKTESR